ncbi:MAG: FtsQ-type POTRA domain-containing protein [Alphaproteobacteria bacterium]|nr:FtsQ-type POTRA domain-containing protein [Alphaproteobacteria bacterium]
MNFIRSLFKSNLFWFLCVFLCFFGVHRYTNFFKSRVLNCLIRKVEFDGNDKVPEALLYKVSGIKYHSDIFSVSVQDVKSKLENIAWIKSVEVQRKLPDTFYIRVTEREPIAILQSKYKLYLLDNQGKVLEHDGIGDFGNLPIVIGDGSEKNAQHLLFVLNQFPKIRKQLVCATFIGKRRWNIKINRGIIVKLPEKHLKHAISVLEEISDDNGFFKEEIVEIDLRMLDRVVIKKKNEGQSS